MSVQGHHIVKLRFEIQLSCQADAFQMQQDLSNHFYRDIQHQMADLFDALISPSELIRLEQLEIDLGYFSVPEMHSEELINRLLEALKKHISPVVNSNQKTPSAKRSSLPEGVFQEWLHFLKHGHLPWPPVKQGQVWEDRILEALVQHGEFPDQLAQELRSLPEATWRLVWQSSEPFLLNLTEIFTGHVQAELLNGLQELVGRCLKFADGKPLWEKLLEFHNPLDYATAIKPKDQIRSVFWYKVLQRILIRGSRESAKQLLAKIIPEMILEDDRNSGTLTIDSHKVVDAGPGERANIPDGREQGIADNDNQPEEWYLSHAGMVLLHPYLVSYFDHVGLLNQVKEFRDLPSQVKAIHLMHYLVTGEREAPEYVLLLPKVLCGFPGNGPLPKEVFLEDHWLEEADHLLEVLVDRWQILGEVSIDSLREGFLQREGKLTKKSSGWLLQVEQQAIDVLLDRLPWGISMIKLPWMKELMQVEWR